MSNFQTLSSQKLPRGVKIKTLLLDHFCEHCKTLLRIDLTGCNVPEKISIVVYCTSKAQCTKREATPNEIRCVVYIYPDLFMV